MPSTRVYLLRHAETATPHVFHGAESDEVLSPLGHATSVLAAEWFHTLNADVVITSAMTRAIQTAGPLLKISDLSHVIEPALHERRVGILGGTPFTLVEGLWVDTLSQWTAGNLDYTTPGAESYAEVRTRVLEAWHRMMTIHSGKTIIMIVHGIVVKILLLSLLPEWGPARWHELGKVANLATSELVGDVETGWVLQQLFTLPPGVENHLESAAASQVPKSVA